MAELSSHPRAFVRPSPTRGVLGGVRRPDRDIVFHFALVSLSPCCACACRHPPQPVHPRQRPLGNHRQPNARRKLPKPLLELDFFAAVCPDEMTWTFDQAKGQLAVMVEKQNGVHWPQLTPASEGQLC